MSFTDLLITIIVVTVLVTLILGGGTYLALRIHRTRGLSTPAHPEGDTRFFVRYAPHGETRTRV